jgi:ABC-type transport system involved in cytochrome c biogenesis permease component
MLVRARSRDMLLPLLLYTITVPVIIAGVGATSSLLQADVNYDVLRFWTVLLTCFDVVFVTHRAVDVRRRDGRAVTVP